MNNSALAIEEAAGQPESEKASAQPGKYSGLVLPPFDPEAAIAVLDWLRQQDPQEQYETFEYLKRALNETRAANGERLLFTEEAAAPAPPNAYGAPLPSFDPEAGIAALQSFYESDAEEQRETFEYLKRALNETRAANGERLHFPDEQDHPA